jgi:hypothetical protein
LEAILLSWEAIWVADRKWREARLLSSDGVPKALLSLAAVLLVAAAASPGEIVLVQVLWGGLHHQGHDGQHLHKLIHTKGIV